ncbi:hypothetical protein [Campylobacter sp. CCUG 57310]|uniref:hypothetical protein n=1 Tax=Campylobacter sp. CCUG 57310 TaxID=2517362 RepID=UPI001566542A|nr:hypothetical protein [Campylobacter sp. CCUG 57310]QKF91373.1 hypothetical protein CORI_0136 [Campylobacter sp. CCUG 57310]
MKNTNNTVKVNFEINDVIVSLNLASKNNMPISYDLTNCENSCADYNYDEQIALVASSVDYSNLTQEEKQFYADILNFIFRGTIGNVQASQITPNVAKAADFFLKEIANCSQGITATLVGLPGGQLYSIAFNIFLKKIESYLHIPYVRALIIEAVTSHYIGNIFKYIFRNVRYRICVDTVNIKWKSQMGLLLYGIIDDLSY